MTFAEKLQILRKSHGWSQEELAAQILISRQAVSKWESGAAIPDTENVLTLADLFGVSTDYLLRDNCESDADTPAVRRKEAECEQARNRAAGWFVCVGIQFFGLIMNLYGSWVAQMPPFILLGVTAQLSGIISMELVFHVYKGLPDTEDIRRKFYRISIWAFSWFPCQTVSSVLFRMGMKPFSTLRLFFLSHALYLLVSLVVTWFLRPRKG